MKKLFVLLSASYLIAVLFTGCTSNIFKSLDKPSAEDSSIAAQFEANEALNSGNYNLAISKIDDILKKDFSGITNVNDLEKYPEKRKTYIDLMSKKGVALLGSSGVEALKLIATITSISTSTTTGDAVFLTDILNSVDLAKVTEASAAFNAALPDSGSLKPEDKEFKSTYQTAAVAFAITAAVDLKEVLDVFNEPGDKTTIQTKANTVLDANREDIKNNLLRAIDCVSVVYPSDSSSIKIDSLSEIEKTLEESSNLTKEGFEALLSGK